MSILFNANFSDLVDVQCHVDTKLQQIRISITDKIVLAGDVKMMLWYDSLYKRVSSHILIYLNFEKEDGCLTPHYQPRKKRADALV